MSWKKSYIIVLVSLIILKLVVLFGYSIHYLDSDQAIMWYGTSEFAKGLFHEPKFFGQNYGTMFESLAAVPFFLTGVPLNISLPLASSIIGVLPYILISLSCARKREYLTGTLILLIPLSLRINHDVITSIPRAFTPGILLAAAGAVLLLDYSSSKPTVITGAFLMLLGFSFNTSSLVISLIATVYFLIKSGLKPGSLAAFSAGSIMGYLFHYKLTRFYINNPEWNLHPDWKTSFSLRGLLSNLKRIGFMYSDLTPFVYHGIVLIIIFAVLIVLAFRRKVKSLQLVAVLSALGTVGLLGISKINDFNGEVLFSPTRMLLGIPVLLALLIKLFSFKESEFDKIMRAAGRPAGNYILVLVVLTCGLKLGDLIINYEKFNTSGLLGVMETKKVFEISKELVSIAEEEDCQVIVFKEEYCSRLLNYAVGALANGKVETLNSVYERRTWRYIEERTKVREKFILVESFYPKNLSYKVIEPQGRTIVKWLEQELKHYRK